LPATHSPWIAALNCYSPLTGTSSSITIRDHNRPHRTSGGGSLFSVRRFDALRGLE
jgi:hypothetical protein